MIQSTQKIFMVRPANFGYNEQTAVSNSFQNAATNIANIKDIAIAEFDNAVHSLRSVGIDVIVIQDSETPIKPDAIFPNNWISTHHDGTIVLYPMCTPNRRIERQNNILETVTNGCKPNKLIDLTPYENTERFLEGTGSIVFDHEARKAYACISVRTDASILKELCDQIGYSPITFHSYDANDALIYHTNVVMAIGTGYAIICLESIKNDLEKQQVINNLKLANKDIIDISLGQVYHFAGNAIEVIGSEDVKYLVLSQSAYSQLTEEQINAIKRYATLLPIAIPNIETVGGGSIRCMIGQIFI